MSTATTTDQAERIIGALRAHEAELHRAGIRHLSLFGSFSRGDARAASDIDLAAEFDPSVRIDLFRLTALERRIAEILGRRVDLLPDPVEKPRLRANVDRDRRGGDCPISRCPDPVRWPRSAKGWAPTRRKPPLGVG